MTAIRDSVPILACAAISTVLIAVIVFAWNITDLFEGFF
jgi:hypothetical protein